MTLKQDTEAIMWIAGAAGVLVVLWAIIFSMLGYYTVKKNPWVASNWVDSKSTQSDVYSLSMIVSIIVLGVGITGVYFWSDTNKNAYYYF